MIVILGVAVIILVCVLVFYYTMSMKDRNYTEYEVVEDLKKRIDELDDDNVNVEAGKKTAKIIVPDVVDANESTRVSTQKEECKEYIVKPDEKIEKTVIGSNKREKDFENTEIERMEDKKEEDNDPIKEHEGLISKLLKDNKKEE